MHIAVFESEVVVICSSTIAEEDKQRAPTVSIAIGCRLVFESEALVTLVSVVADGAPLLFPDSIELFLRSFKFWASAVAVAGSAPTSDPSECPLSF